MLPATKQINTSGGLIDGIVPFPGALFVDQKDSRSAKDLKRSAGEFAELSSSEPLTVLLVDDNETVLSRRTPRSLQLIVGDSGRRGLTAPLQ
jgi:hypothetical protein